MKIRLLCGLVLSALVVLALPAMADATQVLGRFNLDPDTKYQTHPDMSGSVIVYQQKDGSDWNIRGLVGAPNVPICTAAGNQVLPRISGSIVVWEDHRAGNADIWGYDLATSTAFSICTDTHEQRRPRIDGDWVVWQDDRNGNWDVYGCDLTSMADVPICVESHDQSVPDISGDVVVWVDRRFGDKDVYAYDRSAAFEFPVCLSTADQDQPAVSSKGIVWRDLRNAAASGADLYWFDLQTSLERPVTQAPADQSEPAIDGDIVAWTDARNLTLGSGYDVYGVDLTNGDPLLLGAVKGTQNQPAVDDYALVWTDARNSRYADIYGAALTPWTTRFHINNAVAWARSDKVKLSPYARGKSGITTGMLIWNQGAGGTWEAYTTLKDPWYLSSGDGIKTVYVKFRDIDGNESPIVSDKITVDTHGPVCKALKTVTVAKGDTATIAYRVDDGLATQADVTIRIKNKAGATVQILVLGRRATNKALNQRFICDLASGSYSIAISAKDQAGNAQSKIGTAALTVTP
jgi:beta propeller repeat protein